MTDQDILLCVDKVTKTFGAHTDPLNVLTPMSLQIARGEFLGIVGPSGCGKTTLLRIIAGIERPDAGAVTWPNDTPETIRLSFAFQHLALFPWHTVCRNVEFPLHNDPRCDDARDRAVAMTEAFGLVGFEDYYPGQLSGGMRQRVALARAMVTEPNLLILDEPFGALDVCARLKLQDMILSTCGPRRTSVLIVTHDLHEAVRLCDQILVLSARPARIAMEVETGKWSKSDRLGISPADTAPYVEDLYQLLHATTGN